MSKRRKNRRSGPDLISEQVHGDLVQLAYQTCSQLLEKVVKVLEAAAAASGADKADLYKLALQGAREVLVETLGSLDSDPKLKEGGMPAALTQRLCHVYGQDITQDNAVFAKLGTAKYWVYTPGEKHCDRAARGPRPPKEPGTGTSPQDSHQQQEQEQQQLTDSGGSPIGEPLPWPSLLVEPPGQEQQ